MSQPYKRMRVRRYAAADASDDPEARYWKKFRHPVLTKHIGAITHINFSPAEPHDLAVTSSSRVAIYNSKSNSVRRTITRFKDLAYSGTFRSDGKLLVAGGAETHVKVFDVKSKTALRFYKGHTAPVHTTKFSPDKIHILSGSDDKTVRYWDLTSHRAIGVITNAHKDHIRSACVAEEQPSVWATGGYDHMVKLWDVRASFGGEDGSGAGAGAGAGSGAGSASGKDALMAFDHGAPVEAVLMLPGGTSMVSAGGNELKVWDIIGQKLLHTLSNHQKTITTICLDGTGTRLLSGSLDKHVKIYSLETFKVMHGLKCASPIHALGCSPDNSRLVVGMTDGTLSIRQRHVKMAETAREQRTVRALHGGSYRYFMRGKSSTADANDYKVLVKRKPKLQPYDTYLKKFQHKLALDAALETRHPVVVVSLLEELVQRDCLISALGGRDDLSLTPMLQFLVKYVTHPKYTTVLIDIADTVFDLYASALGRSAAVDDLFIRLHNAIRRELTVEKELLQLMGCLDVLMSAQ